jgi:hypothetical protein
MDVPWGPNAKYDEEEDLIYDPDSGKLWRLKELQFVNVDGGTQTIHVKRGHKHVTAPRAVWKVMTGKYPPADIQIDHIDRNKDNNRWNNYRLATQKQNMANRVMYRWRNPELPGISLGTGVYFSSPGRFKVYVKGAYFGTFKTAEEANAVALAKRAEIFGEWLPVEERDEDH